MQITRDEIEFHRPEVFLPPDPEFAVEYERDVQCGRHAAADASVALVAICRNAMPFLPQTLELVERTGAMFREWSGFIYENDSTDDTKAVLSEWADGQQRHVSLNINGRPHLNGTIEPVRTIALAEYRAACQTFVRHGDTPRFVIVFDTDAWSGWSVDGVANSISWMTKDPSWYALASYSWAEVAQLAGVGSIHYDAFAARLNHWQRHDQSWFHLWHPPVGGPPVEFRSAFGQLCVYRGERYLQGEYAGHDCEHVCFHRSIQEAAPHMRMGLNPSSRCVSFFVPQEFKDARRHDAD